MINLEAIEKQLASDRGHIIATANVLALIAEVRAWRERFPAHVYRPQDDCVANRFWLERRQPTEEPK